MKTIRKKQKNKGDCQIVVSGAGMAQKERWGGRRGGLLRGGYIGTNVSGVMLQEKVSLAPLSRLYPMSHSSTSSLLLMVSGGRVNRTLLCFLMYYSDYTVDSLEDKVRGVLSPRPTPFFYFPSSLSASLSLPLLSRSVCLSFSLPPLSRLRVDLKKLLCPSLGGFLLSLCLSYAIAAAAIPLTTVLFGKYTG